MCGMPRTNRLISLVITISLRINIWFTAPDVTIVMENASFVLSAPSGDFTPMVAGSPAPSLIQGKVGSALRLEGAELNYGQPNECFYDVDMCVNGLSVSLWVKFYAASTKAQMILGGGGFYGTSKGMAVFLAGGGVIQINIFNSHYHYIAKSDSYDAFHWQHIVFTWKAYTNVLLYLNGCPVRKKNIFNRADVTDSVDFKIGGSEYGGADERGNIALDHVLMWYDVLTPEEAWKFYVQGGQV